MCTIIATRATRTISREVEGLHGIVKSFLIFVLYQGSTVAKDVGFSIALLG
jgi:hypothetical protein